MISIQLLLGGSFDAMFKLRKILLKLSDSFSIGFEISEIVALAQNIELFFHGIILYIDLLSQSLQTTDERFHFMWKV